MYGKIDMVGKVVNGVKCLREVEPYVSPKGKKQARYEFECPFCESHFVALGSNVRRGLTSSCGCLQKLRSSEYRPAGGWWAEFPRLAKTITRHVYDITHASESRCPWYMGVSIDPKYIRENGSIDKTLFLEDLLEQYPHECREYEKNKQLVLDKDLKTIGGRRVFTPSNISFIRGFDNHTHLHDKCKLRHNLLTPFGEPFIDYCRRIGALGPSEPTNRNKSYKKWSAYLYRTGEIHPELLHLEAENV